MCSYLHRAPNGVYYFRMGIPADLRPFMAGKREIKGMKGLLALQASITGCRKSSKVTFTALSTSLWFTTLGP